ncbi:hypothetical protein HDU99_000141 [Rhizoclosmatium hyalinum]|nr:hypothetical protein HDU99_000141 [Rhizoclosmatium hyalinum]
MSVTHATDRLTEGRYDSIALTAMILMNVRCVMDDIYSISQDPLLDKLLGVARSKLETGAANPSFDVTVWSQTRVIKRLLVAMVEWWVEIRAWLQPSELPEVLDSGFLCEVQSVLVSKANKQILEVGLKIVDTLIREYSK